MMKSGDPQKTDEAAKEEFLKPEANDAKSGKDAAPDQQPEAVEDIEQALKFEREEKEKYLDLLKRNQADFDNYRKRQIRDFEDIRKYKNQDLIGDLLDVLDNFDRAKEAGQSETDFKSYYEGIVLIHKSLYDILDKHGLERIPAEGEVFNPELHEAVATEQTDTAPDHSIQEEYQKGYQLNGKVIRHSKVRIAINDSDDGSANDQQEITE